MPGPRRRHGFRSGWQSIIATLLLVSIGCAAPSEPEQRTLVMDVASELVDCHGFIEQKCLRVSMGPGGPWTLFYEQIAGFSFEPGFEYTLRVERRAIPPVPDGSSFSWRLLEVLRKVPAVGGEA